MLTLLHELHKDACREGLPMLVDEILNVAKVLHRFGPRVFAVRSPENIAVGVYGKETHDAACVGEDQTQIRHVCVGRMKATQSVACGERIQVLVEDEDGDAIWAAARVSRMDADGRFTVEVTEWEESDGASYEDGPFRMNDEGTVWRRIIP